MGQESKSKPSFGLAMVIANYLKRHAEYVWDGVFRAKFGEKARNLPPPAKHGIELGLNILTAVLDEKVASNTPLKKLIKEVLKDSGPEFSKRMMNGVRHPLNNAAQKSDATESVVLQLLLELDDANLKSALDWLVNTPAQKRQEIFRKLSTLSSEELKRLIQLPPETLTEILVGIFEKPEAKEMAPEPAREPPAVSRLALASARVSKARIRLKEKRKGGWLW